MSNAFNWILIAAGLVMVIVEVILGAATGFDFALIGISMAAGGGVGLYFESAKVGMISAGAVTFLYLAFFRRFIRSKLNEPDRPSNTDALIGRVGIVTARIAENSPGGIKVGDEIWRATLARSAAGPKEPGETVTVVSVEGVTLNVR